MLADVIAKKSTNANLLRFIAALMVIISHTPVLMGIGVDWCYQFTRGESSFGGLSVAIFFFLSGLYVNNSLAHTKKLSEFLKKRCKRIFPQIWIATIVMLLVWGPIIALVNGYSIFDYFGNSQTYIYLANLCLIPVHNLPGVFVNNPITTVNGALWTMPVEFVCYLILMAIAWIASFCKKQKKVEKLFHWLGFVVILVIMLGAKLLLADAETIISIIRPVGIFFVGTLVSDYQNIIPIKTSYGLVALLLLVITAPLGLFSFALLLLLPYVICVLIIGTKQMQWDCKLFGMSYEMYIVGYPIQQTLIAISGNHLSQIALNCLAILADIVLAAGLYELTIWLMDRKKK